MGFWSTITASLGGQGKPSRRGKPAARLYAVGDIHGRLDLLEQLLASIDREIAEAPDLSHFVVFLGDLVDRGPDSAGVVERLRGYKPAAARVIFLCGNHEEMFLRVIDGEGALIESWLDFGGKECAQSYGIDVAELRRVKPSAAATLVRDAVPAEHVEFLRRFGDTFRFGDYLLVHAGIRPGIALDEQPLRDLRWIREPFLSDTGDHGFVVVHGHTVVDQVDERFNRIAIDTGAYQSGQLTALVIEGDERRYLTTGNRAPTMAIA